MELSKSQRKFFNTCGKKLLTQALDGFYAFEDDEIENLLDKALIRFAGRIDFRKQTRIYLWSMPKIRAKICQTAYEMWRTK